MVKIIKKRKRFYFAVEGEGDQSFIKWLQDLSDRRKLDIHLDCQLLRGGGYEIMLKEAIKYRGCKERHKVASSILLVDADRSEEEDGWSLDRLRREAKKNKITLCLQIPNQEGLLLRMMPGKDNLQPDSISAGKLLKKEWPEYQKPVDAYALHSKFSLRDLLRVAKVDLEIKELLSIIGLL